MTTSAERQWTAGTLNELVEFIESTHHVFTRAETERLRSLVARVAQVHGAKHPELGEVARLFAALDADLAPHLLKEEHILFPMIRSGDAYAAEGPIEVMLAEHDAVEGLLRELRGVTHDYALPSDACASFGALYEGLQALEADLHRHIHLENNVLFPLVREG